MSSIKYERITLIVWADSAPGGNLKPTCICRDFGLRFLKRGDHLRSFSGGGGPPQGPPIPPESGPGLEKRLCQVVGLNQNYVSTTGTHYHIQIEDRGPIVDRVSEAEVRRLSLIVCANYGEPNERIIHGHDHDFDDIRSHEHNRFIEAKIQDLAAGARSIIEEKEQRYVLYVKALIRDYYRTKDEATKREFEEANALYPFLFSRAWLELKQERARPETSPSPIHAALEEVHYPLDPELREKVLEIERIVRELGQDVEKLRAGGRADDILLQTCRKLVARAKESLTGRDLSEFNVRRLEMTRNSLMTTWKQVKSRLKTQ